MSNSSFTLLEHYGILSVSGRDAAKFLQGYTTNDVQTLSPEAWQPGAFCNLQGRMIANFRMVNQAGQLMLAMNEPLVEVITGFLKKYIVFSNAEMLNISSAYIQIGISGADSAASLLEIFDQVPQNDLECIQREEHILLKLPGDKPRFELWANANNAEPILKKLDQHFDQAEPSHWQLEEIESGWAWVIEQTSEQYIPQMLNLQAQDAISFDKGCYLGQEIVARMQYLGKLKKRMHRYSVTANVSPQVGEKIFNGQSREIGEIVASALNPDSGQANTYEILAVVKDAESEALQLGTGDALEQLHLPYVCAS